MLTNSSYGGWESALLGMQSDYPDWPSKWTKSYLQSINDRLYRRSAVLESRIDGVIAGRTMPDSEQVTIGSGRHLTLAVMFLDICRFSSWPSATPEEQTNVLRVMNIFMAEMLNIVRDYNGTFEKNTGDGFMSYFGATPTEQVEAARKAVYAATVMHYVNEHVLTPWFEANGLWRVDFRVGIDLGQVTLAKVGIHNLSDQLVAIGSTANIACKIMRLLPLGGICIGNEVKKAMPSTWQRLVSPLPSTGFVYVSSQSPYEAWELTHRISTPLL